MGLELLQAQGMGDNACADLADSTIKEINTAISNQQKVLDALDKGSKCKTEGDANVRAMEKAHNAAKDAYKKADQAVSAATKTKVSFNSLSLDTAMQLKNSGKCGKFYEGASFRGAQSAYITAKKQRDSANAQVKASKSAWDKSKIAAAKAKEDCACKARDEMNKAWAAASQSKVRADNDKAWRKAQQMKCVIKGVGMGSCKYASTPVTKKPSLASGVAAMCKRGAAPAVTGPKLFNMPAHHSGSAPAEHARETKACTDRGMRLCTYQELCPKGCGDKTYQDKGHSWVPYSGFNGDYSNNGNSWVFVGTDGGHPSCRDHNGNRNGQKSVCGISNPNWTGDRYGNGMYCCAKNGKEMTTELVEELPRELRDQDVAIEEDAILQEVWS